MRTRAQQGCGKAGRGGEYPRPSWPTMPDQLDGSSSLALCSSKRLPIMSRGSERQSSNEQQSLGRICAPVHDIEAGCDAFVARGAHRAVEGAEAEGVPGAVGGGAVGLGDAGKPPLVLPAADPAPSEARQAVCAKAGAVVRTKA